MHCLPVGAPRQELGTSPIRVLCAGSFPPPQAADALATTTSASEPASKSERGLRSTRGNVQRGWDDHTRGGTRSHSTRRYSSPPTEPNDRRSRRFGGWEHRLAECPLT